MRRRALTLALCAIAGCDLYWDHGGDDDCNLAYHTVQEEYRNPYTGTCEPRFGGGWCDDPCSPCPPSAGEEGADAQPNWPLCHGGCSGLDQASCEITAGCHAAYLVDGSNPIEQGARGDFWACWDIAPLQVTTVFACESLDAYSCTAAENCIGTYATTGDGSGSTFRACYPESTDGVCTNVECGLGAHCEEQCRPDHPTGDGEGAPPSPPCSPICVPDEPYSCATIDCQPGFTCVEVCDDMTPPPPGHPGPPIHCYPTCVEIMSDACELVTDEAACITRADCTPVYAGDDCTCTPHGCTCTTQTFARCEKR